MSIEVRAAGLDAVAAIADVEAAAFDHPWTMEAVRTSLHDDLTRAFVAISEGAVVGAAIVRVVAGEGELLRIAVLPPCRRRGVARLLLERVLASIGRECPYGMHLEVRDANQAARRLYATAGFVETGRRRAYYQEPVEDAVLMQWIANPGRGAAASVATRE